MLQGLIQHNGLRYAFFSFFLVVVTAVIIVVMTYSLNPYRYRTKAISLMHYTIIKTPPGAGNPTKSDALELHGAVVKIRKEGLYDNNR